MISAKNNLVALGSAAVLTVYAAGFYRTKAAADRFAAEDAAGRRPMAEAAQAPQPEATSGDSLVVTSIAQDSATGFVVKASAAQTPPPASAALAVSRPPDTSSRQDSATATINPAQVVAQAVAKAVDSVPAVPTTTAAVVLPAPQGNQGTPPTTQQADASAQSPSRGPYKDGRYSGWGTSRHGNIQATVEIRDGHIASAVISQCLTRYSCSWISALQGQVVARQSANVDYVSGATQSTNAFYYAIVEALSYAK